MDSSPAGPTPPPPPGGPLPWGPVPGGPLPALGQVAVLVPVKAFAHAKLRLAPALPPGERARLARAMATRVLAAAAPLPAVVVCDDADVARWASQHGASVVWTPGRGLNGAVQTGVARLAADGVGQVIVAHADLPLASQLARLCGFPGVTLVPDRRRDGTNVACIPSRAGFRFAYGPQSFSRHRREARRLGLALRVVQDPLLASDVDLPTDLARVLPAAPLARLLAATC